MKELTIEATIENITAVTDFVNGLLEGYHCPMKAQMQIDVAIDELFSNIARYAYGEASGDATVQMEIDDATRTVSITFIDSGVPFNPLEIADPDVTLPAKKRRIGGLGIFMVRKMMDKLEYVYENGCNRLTIYKRM